MSSGESLLDSAGVASEGGTRWTPGPIMCVGTRLPVTEGNPLLRSRVLRSESCTWWWATRVGLLYANQTSEHTFGGREKGMELVMG